MELTPPFHTRLVRSLSIAVRPVWLLPAVALIVICGALQAPLVVATGSSVATWLDDGALALAGALALLRIRRSPWVFAALMFWGALVAIAYFRSSLEPGVALLVARQVGVPMALVFIGSVLNRREWAGVAWIAIAVGVVNSLYMLPELFGLRLIPPANALLADSIHEIFVTDGLPGYYYYYYAEGSFFVRAGGLFLNPPIAGIACAVALVLAWWMPRRKWHWPLAAVLGIAVAASASRAGLLIVAIGLVLPLVRRWIGTLWTVVAALALGSAGAAIFFSHAGSGLHAAGLIQGVTDGVQSVIGLGFGHAGNYSSSVGAAESGESLVGVAVSAMGIPALLVILFSAALLVRVTLAAHPDPLGGLAIAALGAAALSETGGALNGTVALWAVVGVVLSRTENSSSGARLRAASRQRAPTEEPGEEDPAT